MHNMGVLLMHKLFFSLILLFIGCKGPNLKDHYDLDHLMHSYQIFKGVTDENGKYYEIEVSIDREAFLKKFSACYQSTAYDEKIDGLIQIQMKGPQLKLV